MAGKFEFKLGIGKADDVPRAKWGRGKEERTLFASVTNYYSTVVTDCYFAV